MKIIVKILALPFFLALALVSSMTRFLFCFASTIMTILSVVFGMLAIAMLITGMAFHNCAVAMVLAFLISPFGIQAIAEWLIGLLDSASGSIKWYIFG